MFKSELPKIKEGFFKVKNDMLFLSDKITENYNQFLSQHTELSKQIKHMSSELQDQITHIKDNLKNSPQLISTNEFEKMKVEIRELKLLVNDSHGEHLKISSLVESIKQNKSSIKENKLELKSEIKKLKEQTHSSELELYLLKEKLSQKDEEIKELKDISRKMFDIIDDLSRVELDLINHQIKS